MQSNAGFDVNVNYFGKVVSMHIDFCESKFCILYKGELIAEIANNEEWEQVSGAILPHVIFDTIVEQINNFYE